MGDIVFGCAMALIVGALAYSLARDLQRDGGEIPPPWRRRPTVPPATAYEEPPIKDADYYTQQWIDAIRATLGDAFMHMDGISDTYGNFTGEAIPVDIEIHTGDLEWLLHLWKDSFAFDRKLRDAGVDV
jgi:hypothetical protein